MKTIYLFDDGTRSKRTKEDFIMYLEAHPDERFWQSIRNFSEKAFIFATNDPNLLEDTFYWEEKTK